MTPVTHLFSAIHRGASCSQHDFHARAVSDPWRMAKKWNLTWKKT